MIRPYRIWYRIWSQNLFNINKLKKKIFSGCIHKTYFYWKINYLLIFLNFISSYQNQYTKVFKKWWSAVFISYHRFSVKVPLDWLSWDCQVQIKLLNKEFKDIFKGVQLTFDSEFIQPQIYFLRSHNIYIKYFYQL